MCGIAAIISYQGEPKVSKIECMLDAIKHRGNMPPNFTVFGGAILGHVRLQIVDRANSAQPILNEAGNLAIIFNGEIYNYNSLRQCLIDLGHIFKTNCDTEVLVHLYEEYGINMLQHLDGMFALIIYNRDTNDFFAARDPFGVKPLYYSEDHNSIYFSSEMKSFNGLSVKEYKEIPPACYYNKHGMKSYHSYHTLPKLKVSLEEAAFEVRSLLEVAVEKRVKTDLPIGVFLSGGLDSTIVFLLCKKYHKDVTALIIGKEDAPDVIYATKFCKKNNHKYEYINFDSSQALEAMPSIIETIETFEANPIRGACLSYYLAQAAHNMGLRIILCGEGSDEIFGGYGDFLNVQNDNDIDILTLNFLNSLYRTQLLRIDKTGMAFGVEVREPFLDKALVEYALRLSFDLKISQLKNDRRTTKYVLREAFKDILPAEIYMRDKMTLMEGAGAGAVNRGEGIFYDYASKKITDKELDVFKISYPKYLIENKEEAFYLKKFNEKYAKAKFAANRTFNATIEIKGND